MKLVAGAVLFCVGGLLATSAMSTTLSGGGATLPAGGYVGFDFINKPTSGDVAKLSSTPSVSYGANVLSNSLFGAWASSTSNAISYCQTGSGAGKRLLNGDPTGTLVAGGTCGPNSGSPALTGFNITASNSQNPDFIASDAPMSQSEYSLYLANKAVHVEPVQFPSLLGSIAVIYNIPGLPTGKHLNLTDSQVCQVFSGKAAFWDDLTGTVDQTGAALSLPHTAITIVYRSDGSGTSFNFSNHLANNCGASDVISGHFDTDQTWIAAAGSPSVVKDLGGFPPASTPIGANGNPAVVTTVGATPGSVGYTEMANFLHGGVSGVDYAFFGGQAGVAGKDPAADLVTSFNVSGNLLNDVAVTGVTTTGSTPGAPVLSALTSVPGTKACTIIVDPNFYGKTSAFRDPSTGALLSYPIVAVTYLMTNSRSNGTNLTALRSFMLTPYAPASGVTSVGAGTGYAFLTGTGITAVPKISGCVGA